MHEVITAVISFDQGNRGSHLFWAFSVAVQTSFCIFWNTCQPIKGNLFAVGTGDVTLMTVFVQMIFHTLMSLTAIDIHCFLRASYTILFLIILMTYQIIVYHDYPILSKHPDISTHIPNQNNHHKHPKTIVFP